MRVRRIFHKIPLRPQGRLAAGLRSARAGLSRGLAGFALLFLSAAEGALEREVECLARNIYFEARHEPEEGPCSFSA